MKTVNRIREQNIPVGVFLDLYEKMQQTVVDTPEGPKITTLFGDDVVIIGGRAVNLLSYSNSRHTHDIDVVVNPDVIPKTPEAMREFVLLLSDKGFVVKMNPKRDKILGLIDAGGKEKPGTGVEIDIYYQRDVSGVPIDVILNTATTKVERMSKVDHTVKIADPAILIIMKYNTGRPKDVGDIRNLMAQRYSDAGATNPLRNFLEKEIATITRIFPDQESRKKFAMGLRDLLYPQLRGTTQPAMAPQLRTVTTAEQA